MSSSRMLGAQKLNNVSSKVCNHVDGQFIGVHAPDGAIANIDAA